VAKRRNPARLVVALSVAAALAIFLLYTSIAGGGTATIKPSELRGRTGQVQLVGTALGPLAGNSYKPGGLRFRLQDIGGKPTVSVVYTGEIGPSFKLGRNILVTGRLRNGVFVAKRDSMITKCPSKYIPKKNAT
jgi:cytochrome c-type biogenesis protein CcmE